ncbi:MAG: RNA polymerase sigma factor [Proteobacteria bacterium]|nr:RNA polymerase sigma factor [Pseudomonadota bacterium]
MKLRSAGDSAQGRSGLASQGALPAPEPGGDIVGLLEQGRRQFLALVDHVRPELHRYCTRMTGSVADGEDVVQDTLARACYELSQMTELPPLRPWLFRIAHNRAIDQWRRETYRAAEDIEAARDLPADAADEPENRLARDQAVQAALVHFLALAPAQRGCVILKDVLDHTLVEIAEELSLSEQSVKAALHRGRAALQQLAAATTTATAAAPPRRVSPELGRYAALFGARDWDGIRALLADDVRLDLVSRRKAAGRREVATYYGNYDRTAGWRVAPAWVDGRGVLAVYDAPDAAQPAYFIALTWRSGRLAAIRDYRYVPYIGQDHAIELQPQEADRP